MIKGIPREARASPIASFNGAPPIICTKNFKSSTRTVKKFTYNSLHLLYLVHPDRISSPFLRKRRNSWSGNVRDPSAWIDLPLGTEGR